MKTTMVGHQVVQKNKNHIMVCPVSITHLPLKPGILLFKGMSRQLHRQLFFPTVQDIFGFFKVMMFNYSQTLC